jgi:hypothetical protein
MTNDRPTGYGLQVRAVRLGTESDCCLPRVVIWIARKLRA